LAGPMVLVGMPARLCIAALLMISGAVFCFGRSWIERNTAQIAAEVGAE
jgi:hypothetical protein